ncbi:MAG: endonuclease III [bacterium]|nr:endonuclease III [bacterium]
MRPEDLAELAARLEEVYGQPRPETSRPLDELVRGILSQSTTDRQRDQAYRALRARFPTGEAVRDAGEEAVAAVIAPAGLARQKAARIVAVLHELTAPDGRVDLDDLAGLDTARAYRRLVSLPGVGPKTAACVLLFSLGRPVFPVDTHVLRLARRLGLAEKRTGPARVQEQLTAATPPGLVLSLHVNLILHGRQVCRARRPRCGACPLAGRCPTSHRS